MTKKFTLLKVLAILTEPKSQDICGLFLRERENPAMGTYEATELYRQTVVKQLEVDENVYRVDFVSRRCTLDTETNLNCL